MKKIILMKLSSSRIVNFLILGSIMFLSSCEEGIVWNLPEVPCECPSFFRDIRDNQVYRVVKLGCQCWMGENLNYGRRIQAGTDLNNRICDLEPCKYCLDNDERLCDTLGALYTPRMFLRGQLPRGICPEGWHIPSDEEWKLIEKSIGMPQDEIDKFEDSNVRGIGFSQILTDIEGFNSEMVGVYNGPARGCVNDPDSCFQFKRMEARYWTVTTSPKNNDAYIQRRISRNDSGIGRSDGSAGTDQERGFCLRCVKD